MSIALVWSRLMAVRRLTFRATSTLDPACGGAGSGVVVVENMDDHVLVFHEQGKWTLAAGATLPFTNVYRWTRRDAWPGLQLEHLRWGPRRPVFLCDLVPAGEQTLRAIEPHRCGDDVYTPVLRVEESGLRLDWSVQGPSKNDHIMTNYAA